MPGIQYLPFVILLTDILFRAHNYLSMVCPVPSLPQFYFTKFLFPISFILVKETREMRSAKMPVQWPEQKLAGKQSKWNIDGRVFPSVTENSGIIKNTCTHQQHTIFERGRMCKYVAQQKAKSNEIHVEAIVRIIWKMFGVGLCVLSRFVVMCCWSG